MSPDNTRFVLLEQEQDFIYIAFYRCSQLQAEDMIRQEKHMNVVIL